MAYCYFRCLTGCCTFISTVASQEYETETIQFGCQRSDETKVTGPLSTKEEVTAHQNCLLFSSGIYCQSSPQFDDLFGFSVRDVITEVKRGKKLICKKCKKKGATAGCEVKRCKRSYHFPCAIQEGAKTFEETDNGNFGLYCCQHSSDTDGNNASVSNGASSLTKTQISKGPSKAGPSKKNTGGEATPSGLSAHRSHSSSPSSVKHLSSKKRLILEKQDEPPAKRKSKERMRIITDDSSNSDDDEPDADIELFAPLESDLDGESQPIGNNSESPAGSTSENQLKNASEDETDSESESPLPPTQRSVATQSTSNPYVCLNVNMVKIDVEGWSTEQNPVHAAEGQRGSAVPSPNHCLSTSPPCTSWAISPTPPSSPHLRRTASTPAKHRDAASFWKSCNTAGCTQAIFTDFINEMNNISGRIQSGQASQEDYDLALAVMEASGKLAELVTKQQEEIQRKQMELNKAAASMEEVVSALTG